MRRPLLAKLLAIGFRLRGGRNVPRFRNGFFFPSRNRGFLTTVTNGTSVLRHRYEILPNVRFNQTPAVIGSCKRCLTRTD